MSKVFEFFAWHWERTLAIAVALGLIAAALYALQPSYPRVRAVPLMVAAGLWLAWSGWEWLIPKEDYMRVDLLLLVPAMLVTTLVCALLSWRWG